MDDSDDQGENQAEEPTFDEVLEVIGEDPTGEPLPQGRQVCSRTQKPPQRADATEGDTLILSAHKQEAAEGLVSVVTVAEISDQSPQRGCDDEAAETTEDIILRLPSRWMQRYIREMMACGLPSEARSRAGGLSVTVVAKALAEHPSMAALHAQAIADRHERVDAAVYRGATEGDDVPVVSQGEVISTVKKRCVKSGELYYKRHGLMAADQVNVTHASRVEIADESQMADMLRDVALLLHGQPRRIEGKVVSESDRCPVSAMV